jgi:ferredoxin
MSHDALESTLLRRGGWSVHLAPYLEGSYEESPPNLLDFAERNGLAVDSGCRSGSCGACQTRLLSGVVTYADKPDHEIPKGHCLLCVGKPQSALVLDT